MKKHLLGITSILTISLFIWVLVGGSILFANCPGGTVRVHVIGHDQEVDADGCLVSYQAGGHLIYCPSSGMVLEDHSYWRESMRSCP